MQLARRSPLSAVAFFAALTSVIAGPLAAVDQQLLIPNDFQQPQLEAAERKLTGKFLHITDRFYIPGSKTDATEACHHGKGNAGSLGAPGTDCDSPELLVNQTFDWIEENLRDQIDFVIWTGDSARHDNDERIPRTENQIEEFNEVLATKFIDVFSHRRNHPDENLIIPIVPNIGNNDIMPHNVFEKGPNRWTQKLARLWSPFIPEEQRHTFIEGGYFRTDVIPNKLAVFSLNTLYFFDSNPAVDGCAQKSEPGYQQMEWLRVQLQLVRERGMKALLTGHVPPARSSDKQAWDETCWQKYTLWLQQYRDIVVGGLFGHMNIDHFMFQDAKEIDINAVLQGDHMPAITAENSYDNFTIASKGSYLSSLRDMWARLPTPPASVLEEEWSKSETHDGIDSTKKKHRKGKKAREKRKFFKKIGGEYAERFSVSLVSPSVVPNYYPSLRVIEYDTTGLGEAPTWSEIQRLAGTTGDGKQTEHEIEVLKKSKKTPIPDPPSKSDPPGPAYSRQPLTLLNIAQYYANITRERTPKTTGPSTHSDADEALSEGYRLVYELEYRTDEDDVYMLHDLTMRSIYNLATRIGNVKSSSSHLETSAQVDIDRKNNDGDQTEAESSGGIKHAKTKEIKKRKPGKDNDSWKAFVERAFVGFLSYNEVEERL